MLRFVVMAWTLVAASGFALTQDALAQNNGAEKPAVEPPPAIELVPPSEAPKPRIPALEEVQEGANVPEIAGLTPLSANYGLWIDKRKKWVVMDGRVCLNKGVLEMFACPKGTKEHESVIAVDCPAHYVHAALLAVGAKSGKPVQFQPDYQPASGQEINVHILWVDKDGKRQSARAQEWIRNTKTKKQLEHPFVFGGSSFWSEVIDGERLEHYQADAGDLICVSNFPSATLDIPVKSSKENSQLLFEVFPGRVPARGTRLRLVLIPQADKSNDQDAAKAVEKVPPPEKDGENPKADEAKSPNEKATDAPPAKTDE